MRTIFRIEDCQRRSSPKKMAVEVKKGGLGFGQVIGVVIQSYCTPAKRCDKRAAKDKHEPSNMRDRNRRKELGDISHVNIGPKRNLSSYLRIYCWRGGPWGKCYPRE